MEPSVQDLILQFNRGSAQAYTIIYNLCSPSIYYFAKRFVGDRQAAEEITADSFIKLYRLHDNFDSLPNIRAFLRITTRNACLNYLRSLRSADAQKQELLYVLSQEGGAESPVDQYQSDLLQRINEEVEKLPKKCRQVFKMAYMEGRGNEEIARILNINYQSVKNQKTRALKILRLALLNKGVLAFFLIRIYRVFLR
ncbi:MAG TPA: RNA polymerase sigma-70 factor [Puia sp.]|jgi:RNA polymerase sigma-70 factor (ECF subfamily)|nr:RNA polymerase sigma-70 factor [Puia sp.]